MRFIAHRGNLTGPNPLEENKLEYIDKAILEGYDVEIDLRTKNKRLFLGHDSPDYEVTLNWISDRKENLWIHVKDYASLVVVMETDLKYFCHEQDKYTLTSNGYIWSHDLSNQMNKKCIVPLLSKEAIRAYKQRNFYAVCTDYILESIQKFGEK
ncbi:MAG TPA: hypothetical protein EYG21_00825 [Nitrospinaceae bacterium]|jgi:glycerophosphoryl diester phosphodiesterase|nr:hypothetical protein [Nitrospinaceae bacterium]